MAILWHHVHRRSPQRHAKHGGGMVFRLAPSGVLTTLYSFTMQDGYYPEGALIQATDGNLYGTTTAGGTSQWDNIPTHTVGIVDRSARFRIERRYTLGRSGAGRGWQSLRCCRSCGRDRRRPRLQDHAVGHVHQSSQLFRFGRVHSDRTTGTSRRRELLFATTYNGRSQQQRHLFQNHAGRRAHYASQLLSGRWKRPQLPHAGERRQFLRDDASRWDRQRRDHLQNHACWGAEHNSDF